MTIPRNGSGGLLQVLWGVRAQGVGEREPKMHIEDVGANRVEEEKEDKRGRNVLRIQ